MTNEKMSEIQADAFTAAVSVVKAQIAKGAPNKGMSKARHVAVVADVVVEMLGTHFPVADVKDGPVDAEDVWNRKVLRAALSGSLLNASQLRQELEKTTPPTLVKETALNNEYSVCE